MSRDRRASPIPSGKGLGVTFCDFDRDGDTDIYVANDTVRNFLYRNNGDGTFADVAYGAGVGFDANGKPQAGMGTDCADVDGNGFPDLFVTNFSEELNTLYEQSRRRHLRRRHDEGGTRIRLHPTRLRHEALRRRQRRRPRHLRDERTRHRQRQAVPAEPDLRAEGPAVRESRRHGSATSPRRAGPRSRSSASAAGWPSRTSTTTGISTSSSRRSDARPCCLKNQGTAAGNWIMIEAKGTKSNALRPRRDRHGARPRPDVQVKEINNVASYLSSQRHPPACRASARPRSIQQIEVLWPSGTTQILKDVAVNQILVVDEPK